MLKETEETIGFVIIFINGDILIGEGLPPWLRLCTEVDF